MDTTYRQATIDVPTTNKTTIVVRDADGDINGRVFKGTAEKATDADKIEIDTKSFTKGVYIIQLKTKKGNQSKKFLKL